MTPQDAARYIIDAASYENMGMLTRETVERRIASIVSAVANAVSPRCETCAHWSRRKHATIELPGKYGTCSMIGDVANILSTREDFGCVRWKEKV